jgi:hypothetical protein
MALRCEQYLFDGCICFDLRQSDLDWMEIDCVLFCGVEDSDV